MHASENSIRGRAAVLDRFGGADQLTVRELTWSKQIAADEILVRNYATSINPIEWKMREGHGLPRFLWRRLLKDPIVLGLDFAGEVIAAGERSGFVPGDRVMGALPLNGGYAEIVRLRVGGTRGAVAHVGPGVRYQTAALLPFVGLVALAGLGRTPGASPLNRQRVLIIGASGGVGHVAVQIARRGLHAVHVAAICSRRNADFVLACGAHEVVPHDELASAADLPRRRNDWLGNFDLIFDASGVDEYYTAAAPRLLRQGGRFVSIALPISADGQPGEAAEPVAAGALALRLAWRSVFGRYRLVTGLLGGLRPEDLDLLSRWLAEGKVIPHEGAGFDLAQIAEAHRLSEAGITRGKISVVIAQAPSVHADRGPSQ